jgi:hypothetical protein
MSCQETKLKERRFVVSCVARGEKKGSSVLMIPLGYVIVAVDTVTLVVVC